MRQYPAVGHIGILIVLAAFATNAAPVEFRSPERQVALLELYTSEGCSSCPPAESWLSGLKEKPGLWSEFVPVAFHVDYWDRLGWRDHWSNKQFSDRQNAYAAVWRSDTIYTPEFVLNGQEWHNWLGLRGAPNSNGTKAGILKVSSTDGTHWEASFVPTTANTTGYEANAAILVSGVGSEVKSGENAGRHLQHDFVAIELVRQPLLVKGNEFRGAFTFNAQSNAPSGRPALAVWVTQAGQLEPVQSTGGWLAAPATSK